MAEENIPESAKMEEGIAVAPGERPPLPPRLSTVSKMYDVNGDGELDEAELAMRNMDQTGRGYLTNDKVYTLMQEQLKMQRSMFQMKKAIIGLVVLVSVLALSNLGTSFASAILAKDTTTNDKNELVNKDSGEALATAKSFEEFEAMVPSASDGSARKLACATVVNGQEFDCEVGSSDFTEMSKENALELLKKCRTGKLVRMTYTWLDAPGKTYQRTVCNPDWGCLSEFVGGGNPTEGTLCIGDAGVGKIYVKPVRNSEVYTISSSESTVATADILTSNEGQLCSDDDDCDSGLACQLQVIDAGMQLPPMNCTTADNCTGISPTWLCPASSMCSECDVSDTNACPDSKRPACIDFEANGVNICGCDGDDECGNGETCGVPSCVADVTKFCSTNHDAEWDCKICSTTPSAENPPKE